MEVFSFLYCRVILEMRRYFATQVSAPWSVLINMKKKHWGWQWGPFSPVSTARTDLWVHVRKRGQSLLCCCVFACVCVSICYWSWESLVVWRSVSFSAADSRSGSGQSAPQIRQRRSADVGPFYRNEGALQKVCAAARPEGGSHLALHFTSLCKHADVRTTS